MAHWFIRFLVAIILWSRVPIAHGQDAVAPPLEAPPSAHATLETPDPESDTPTAADIAVALQRYRHEPSLGDVVTAAIAHQRSNPDRVLALAARARTAGWMPSVKLSARRGQTIDLLAAQTTTTDRNSASTGDDLVLEAQLMFDLAKVVWSTSEMRVEREFRAERKAEQELVQSITKLYFERRRLQLTRDLGHAADVTDELRILEIEGLLDGFTGGTFSRSIRRTRIAH